MEQFDDILRTFINETNNLKNRFGTIRGEEKMFAVKKLLPETVELQIPRNDDVVQRSSRCTGEHHY